MWSFLLLLLEKVTGRGIGLHVDEFTLDFFGHIRLHLLVAFQPVQGEGVWFFLHDHQFLFQVPCD